MSGFFEYCILFYGLEYNVAKRVGQFKLKNIKTEHDFYTLKEFKHFIKFVDNMFISNFLLLCFLLVLDQVKLWLYDLVI